MEKKEGLAASAHWGAWLVICALFTVGRYDSLAQAPTVSREPQSLNVAAGMNATFSVLASGSGPLRYQWLLNDSPVSTATNAMLTVTNAQADKTGIYRVVITNSIDSATSAPALLVLGPIRFWGTTYSNMYRLPLTATNVTAIAAGYHHSVALKEDGTVVAWGANSLRQTNAPASLSNVVAISSKWDHTLA